MSNDFDIASKQYDNVFTFSSIGKAQRGVVYNYLTSIFNSRSLKILEVNCGTGEDAICLAKRGHKVIATDIAEGMINTAKSKTKLSNLEFKILDFMSINNIYKPESLDVIFSNFGGLNCIDSLSFREFVSNSNIILKPNGKLIMVIMPKYCIWEIVNFLVRAKFKQAFRRNTKGYVLANVDGVQVKTWYYNPSDIIKLAKPYFKVNLIKPIGLCIPPSYLQGTVFSKPFCLNTLIRLERVFSLSVLSKYADHYIIELEKK